MVRLGREDGQVMVGCGEASSDDDGSHVRAEIPTCSVRRGPWWSPPPSAGGLLVRIALQKTGDALLLQAFPRAGRYSEVIGAAPLGNVEALRVDY